MAQIRLTHKFAKDLKVEKLNLPQKTHHPLDDWFFDYLFVRRRKIAVITHASSLFTFFIPYAEAGGAKNLVSYFTEQLINNIRHFTTPSAISEVFQLFQTPSYYCKTIDKRVLGHMNEFKRMISFYDEGQFRMDWHVLSSKANETPIFYGKECSYPLDAFNRIIATLSHRVIH